MLQASGFDGVGFEPVSFRQDGLTTTRVEVSRRQIADALVVAEMVVVHYFILTFSLALPRKFYS